MGVQPRMVDYSNKVKSLSHVLCDPMDCSLPGFSIHGIFQARIPEWVAISFSRKTIAIDWVKFIGFTRCSRESIRSCIVGSSNSLL